MASKVDSGVRSGLPSRGDFRRRALELEERRRQNRGASTEGMVVRRDTDRAVNPSVRVLRPRNAPNKAADTAAANKAAALAARINQQAKPSSRSQFDDELMQNVELSDRRSPLFDDNGADEHVVKPKLIVARSSSSFRSTDSGDGVSPPTQRRMAAMEVSEPQPRGPLRSDYGSVRGTAADEQQPAPMKKRRSIVEGSEASFEEPRPNSLQSLIEADRLEDARRQEARRAEEEARLEEARLEEAARREEEEARRDEEERLAEERREAEEKQRVAEEIRRIKELARAKGVSRVARTHVPNAGDVVIAQQFERMSSGGSCPDEAATLTAEQRLGRGIYDSADALSPTAEWDISADVEGYMFTPPPPGLTVQCRVEREKKGLLQSHPDAQVYTLILEGNGQPILAARRRAKSGRAANYVISLDRKDMSRTGPNFVGKLRSNFVGTEFVFFNKGDNPLKAGSDSLSNVRQELGSVVYETNVMGAKGPRKMKIAIPAVVDCDRRAIWQPLKPEESMVEKFKAGDMEDLIGLQNKAPVWNDALKSYVLNFHKRIKKPSIKNFQVCAVDDTSTVMMQFGRVTSSSFSLDFAYPLSAFQAFCIALSSFDNKLAVE